VSQEVKTQAVSMQPTSLMALFFVLLPDSQFLSWSHSAWALVHVNCAILKGGYIEMAWTDKASFTVFKVKSKFVCIVTPCVCRAQVCSTSRPCVTYLLDSFTEL